MPYAGTPFGLILYPVAIYQDLPVPTTEFVFLKEALNRESLFSMCQESEFIKALRKKTDELFCELFIKSCVHLPLINNCYRYPRMYHLNVPYIADLGVKTQIGTVCIGCIDWENAWLWSRSPDIRFTFAVCWFCRTFMMHEMARDKLHVLGLGDCSNP